MSENITHLQHAIRNPLPSAGQLQKWGGWASFLTAAAFIIAPLIYLSGNLETASGPFTYSLADILYGPLWAASLVTSFFALRERIGSTTWRMSGALQAAFLAAGAMLLVASIRAANRHYHLTHPDLQLESSIPVLVVWTTLVAGVTAAGWHCLGWALLLLGCEGWSSGRLPRGLNFVYLSAGGFSLLVFLFPALEGFAAALGVLWSVWQGIILLKKPPEGGQAKPPSSAG